MVNMAIDISVEQVCNDGERLVPGETHDASEVVRHKSSYAFFRKVIESDILNNPNMLNKTIRVLDIGSGTGHGTFMLGEIIGVEVVGLEVGAEAVGYAKKHYSRDNLEYVNSSLESYLENSFEFDYVVSRHALEHILDGLNLALKIPFQKRLMVNVPFNESDVNPHHLVHWINEDSFANYANKTFFYESLSGITTLKPDEAPPSNSIVCISSQSGMRNVLEYFCFPLPQWAPEFLQYLGLIEYPSLITRLNNEKSVLNSEISGLREVYQTLLNSRGVRAIRFIRKMIGYTGIGRQK